MRWLALIVCLLLSSCAMKQSSGGLEVDLLHIKFDGDREYNFLQRPCPDHFWYWTTPRGEAR